MFYKKADKELANLYSQKNTSVGASFLIQNITKSLRAPNLKNICGRLLLKLKRLFIWNYYIYMTETSENVCFYFMKETTENACFYFGSGFLWSLQSYDIYVMW